VRGQAPPLQRVAFTDRPPEVTVDGAAQGTVGPERAGAQQGPTTVHTRPRQVTADGAAQGTVGPERAGAQQGRATVHTLPRQPAVDP
jgi:hypothetical protein